MKIHLKIPNLICWIWIKVFVIPIYLQPWYGIWLFSWPRCRQDLQYIHWLGQVGSLVSYHSLTNGTMNNELSSFQDTNNFILPYKAWLYCVCLQDKKRRWELQSLVNHGTLAAQFSQVILTGNIFHYNLLLLSKRLLAEVSKDLFITYCNRVILSQFISSYPE